MSMDLLVCVVLIIEEDEDFAGIAGFFFLTISEHCL